MSEYRNALDQPIGYPMPTWQACPPPARIGLNGRFCRLEPLDPEVHAAPIYAALQQASDGVWTYLPYGPYREFEAYYAWQKSVATSDDPLFYTVIDQTTDLAVGVLSLMRIDPAYGVIEVGHVHFSPLLQSRPAATEAVFLLMQYIFDELGYRRFEWKCDSLNAPSRRAAVRFGFTFEGIFRQARSYKGRSRDTSWYAMIDKEWPALKPAYESWLHPDNFDADGQQRSRLSALTAAALQTGA